MRVLIPIIIGVVLWFILGLTGIDTWLRLVLLVAIVFIIEHVVGKLFPKDKKEQ